MRGCFNNLHNILNGELVKNFANPEGKIEESLFIAESYINYKSCSSVGVCKNILHRPMNSFDLINR